MRRDSIPALVGRGHALRELSRNDEALISYDRVLVLDPANLDALENKIKVLDCSRSPCGRAIVLRDRAVRLPPDHIGIVNTHSVALLYLGRPDEALAAAKTALSLDAKNGAAHFNLGNALYALGDYEEAEASFRQAIALAPRRRGRPQESRRGLVGAGAIR